LIYSGGSPTRASPRCLGIACVLFRDPAQDASCLLSAAGVWRRFDNNRELKREEILAGEGELKSLEKRTGHTLLQLYAQQRAAAVAEATQLGVGQCFLLERLPGQYPAQTRSMRLQHFGLANRGRLHARQAAQ